MQRHVSDSFAISLGPRGALRPAGPYARRHILEARGTVSMPTSPVLRAAELTWEMPASAGVNPFAIGSADGHRGGGGIVSGARRRAERQDGPFPPPSASSSAFPTAGVAAGAGEANVAYHNHAYSDTFFPSSPHPRPVPRDAYVPPLDRGNRGYDEEPRPAYDDEEEGGERPRKKRAQVRIACTHCQKACKKCSNTRPCERCVKYGLKDCVDSTRKPRKTGIKRGPYKRRSSKYALSPSSAGSALPPHASGSNSGAGRYYPPHSAGVDGGSGGGGGGWWDSPRPLDSSGYAAAAAYYDDPSGIPPPRGPSLSAAFSAALHGPRWVNGQRVIDTPHTQAGDSGGRGGAFPLSLHHTADPFSRAVSPIRQLPRSALGGGMYTAVSQDLWDRPLPMHASGRGSEHMGMQISPTESIIDSASTDMDMETNMDMGMDIDMSGPLSAAGAAADSPWISGALPWDSQIASAPTSPRPSSAWPDLVPRSSSAEPPTFAFGGPNAAPHSAGPSFARFAPGVHSPAMIALKKIRKPSLRTLMSPLSSASASRAASPVGPSGAEQSPTLYQGPMALDDDVPGLVWDLPDGGAGSGAGGGSGSVGRDLRHVEGPTPMEGLGLTLENVFQT